MIERADRNVGVARSRYDREKTFILQSERKGRSVVVAAWQSIARGDNQSIDIRDSRFLQRSSDVRGVAVGHADSLDQQDDDHLTLRIDPTLRAERAPVPKGSRREILRGALRFADDAPTQSPGATRRETRFQVAALHRRHLPYRFG
jgi:hypothetical protein